MRRAKSLVKERYDLGGRVVRQPVVYCLSGPPRGHQVVFAQSRQKLGHAGLTHFQKRFQLAHRPFPSRQMAQNHQPAFMRERFQECRRLFGARRHIRRSIWGYDKGGFRHASGRVVDLCITMPGLQAQVTPPRRGRAPARRLQTHFHLHSRTDLLASAGEDRRPRKDAREPGFRPPQCQGQLIWAE